MNTYRIIGILGIALLFNAISGCSKQSPVNHEKAMALYFENNLEEALPLFEDLVAQDPGNYVWLAETYRRLGKKKEALNTARRALELNPHSSFAHMVIAEASNPVVGAWAEANSDTTWFHAMKAIECDSNDGNPWLLVWGEAIRRNEPEMMKMSLKKMVETGFFTKAALSYGRWMLRALPANAILLTNGDMDTYPPCAVQETEGLRKDVVIINRGTLNTDWYLRFLRDYAKVPLPVNESELENIKAFQDSSGKIITVSDQIFRGWVEQKAKGQFIRPITVAVTVDDSYLAGIGKNMRYAGSFQEWTGISETDMPDTASIRASIEGLSPDDLTGPWATDQDRSPIRRKYTKNIVRNVTIAAIIYSESLLGANQVKDAYRWMNWADELDHKAELGPAFKERIAQLKEHLAAATP